jgi:signal transduction histidine kinase
MNKRFELDELRAQQEREKMDHERQQFRLTMLIAVLIVAALSLFIYFRYRSAKRLKEEHQKLVDAYAQLETSNNQLSTLNTELTQANARAEESSMMKTNFIQQISHEIRTPLNILSGFTQIITTPGMELDEETRADINRQITENTGRITGLVNKMLELSDANSQAVIERNDDVSAIQLAAEAAEASRIGETAGMSFDFDIAPDTETVMLHTNHQQAVRALTLLLDNARKFLVRPGEELHGSVKLALRQDDGGMFSFIIEDTGIGIPAEEAEHIFDEFVQLDDYYDGTGIGLTVARSIVRRLGGDIVLDTSYQGMATAEASTSKGSRFVVTLPL